jgi:hypothetical protein
MARHKLQKIYCSKNSRLQIIGPSSLNTWIKSYFKVVYKDHDIKIDELVEFIPIIQKTHSIGIGKISPIPVIHCQESFGFVLETATDFKLV